MPMYLANYMYSNLMFARFLIVSKDQRHIKELNPFFLVRSIGTHCLFYGLLKELSYAILDLLEHVVNAS